MNSLIVVITSWYSRIRSPDDAVTLTSTPRAPARFMSSSSGLRTACSAAFSYYVGRFGSYDKLAQSADFRFRTADKERWS